MLLGIEGSLKQIAADRKLGTEWVDTFFPSVERGKKGKKRKNEETTPS